MSRAINLPSQSVKLTNVAIVRLTIQSKRFEIACYKNKVLDYRNGLETDLSEVLQTSNIHVFTNVTKGQFASSTDCIAAFGAVKGKSQDDMAIHILLHGKSIQVSEMERQQLYDATLLQIATHIATTCINPNTGIPYTTSQIKHALTSSSSLSAASSATDASHPNQNQNHDNTKKKGKKNNKKANSNTSSSTSAAATSSANPNEPNYQHFVIQPHKPMKQQYLQAIKYLQYNHILPIVRASMELIWHYPTKYDSMVIQILQELHIPMSIDPNNVINTSGASVTTTTFKEFNHEQHQHDRQEPSVTDAMSTLTINTGEEPNAKSTTTTDSSDVMMSRTMIVDPSLYRILQEYTPMNDSNSNTANKVIVPNSRIEILRQQVFQKQQLPPPQTQSSFNEPTSTSNVPQKQSIDDADSNSSDNDDDSDTNHERRPTRRNHLQQLRFDDDDDDDEDDDDTDTHTDVGKTGPKNKRDITEENEVDEGNDDVEDDSDDQLQQQIRGRNKKSNDKKKKKKHLQLVQSQMVDEHAVSAETTHGRSKTGHHKTSKKNVHNTDEQNVQVDETSTIVESFGNAYGDGNNTNNITTTGTSTTEKPHFTCNTCIGIENAFHTTAEYRAHYRSDWHRYNQKLKSCQATPISYSEFITCDAQSFFNTSNDEF